jgi:membrane protease YdiL (CAAX protease family)
MLPEKPWKLDAVVRLFLGVMTTFCLGLLLASLLDHLISSWPKAQADFCQVVLGALFLEIPALAWIRWFLRQHHISCNEAFGLRMTSPAKAIAYGALGAAVFLPAAWGLSMLSDYLMDLVHLQPQTQVAIQELQDPDLTVAHKAVLGVIVVVFAPIAEEALFRGILYPALKQQGWPRLALWGSSALFAAVHFNVAIFVPLFGFALVLVYLYETRQNLLAPIVAHALFNAANFLLQVFNDPISRLLHLT